MTTTVLARAWAPQSGPQTAFIESQEREVLYGGAAGGGKTDALLGWAIGRRWRFPGSAGLFLRRTFADLSKEGAAIARSHELLSGNCRWNDSQHKWTFPNGSVLEFGHCEHETDRFNYQGSQYADICFDELTQFTELQYLFIIGRARQSVDGSEPRIRCASNPIGIGHAWVRRRFVDAAEPFTTFTISEEVIAGTKYTRTARYLPARLTDNPILLASDPQYGLSLAQLPEAERKAMLEGDWDAFVGEVFREWSRAVHVVSPFEVPATWRRWTGIDYGYLNPFCCLWAARDPDGPMYVYRETYGDGYRAEQQADMVRSLEQGETVSYHYADPSMWQKKREHGLDMSVADIYAGREVRLLPANNDRLAGKARIHKALAFERHPATGEVLRLPELRIFNTCEHLIRTIPALPRDPNQKEDVDTRAEDHAYDALRYLVMAAPTAGRQPGTPGGSVSSYVSLARRRQ